MKRRNFLRDCLMGIAISLVPKILQPVVPDALEESGYNYVWRFDNEGCMWASKEAVDLFDKWCEDFMKKSMIGK